MHSLRIPGGAMRPESQLAPERIKIDQLTVIYSLSPSSPGQEHDVK